MGRSCMLLFAVVSATLVLAPSANSAVRLGPDLTPQPFAPQLGVAAVGCQSQPQYSPCLYLNYASSNADVRATAPSSGIVTRWRFRAGCCVPDATAPTVMTLRTFKPSYWQGANPQYGWAHPDRTGPSFVIPVGNQVLASDVVDLGAHLQIDAGDQIGIAADYPVSFSVYNPTAGVNMVPIQNTSTYNGGGTGPTEFYANPFGGIALTINADIEPDADGDGFGDETQDCQPGDPTKQDGNCNPPAPSPPPLLNVAKPCPPGGCGGGPGGGAVFSGIPSQPSGPRSDGGVDITLKCPANVTQPCGGILYAELPPVLKKSSISKAKAKRLGSLNYSLKIGETKKFKLKFTKSAKKLLKKKRKRTINVVIQPNDGGQLVTTTKTLKFKR